jgi:predicted DNA-binding protein YlxM (UPF0122 family)
LPILTVMLPRTQRLFFRLWVDHDLTFEEIAELYGTTEEHVEEVVNRAVENYDRLAGGREGLLQAEKNLSPCRVKVCGQK